MTGRHQVSEAVCLENIARCEQEVERREAASLAALDALLKARKRLAGWRGRLEADRER